MYLKSLSLYLSYRVASTLIFNAASNPRYSQSSCYYPSFSLIFSLSVHSHLFPLRSRMGEIGAHPYVGACCACLSSISRVRGVSFLFVVLFVVHTFYIVRHSGISSIHFFLSLPLIILVFRRFFSKIVLCRKSDSVKKT